MSPGYHAVNGIFPDDITKTIGAGNIMRAIGSVVISASNACYDITIRVVIARFCRNHVHIVTSLGHIVHNVNDDTCGRRRDRAIRSGQGEDVALGSRAIMCW